MALWGRLRTQWHTRRRSTWRRRERHRDDVARVYELLLANPDAAHYAIDLAHRAPMPIRRLYPALAHLERDGLAGSSWEVMAGGARPRRVYRLASTGRPTSTIHAGPPRGTGFMPCCDRTPLEVPLGERLTYDPTLVTCPGRP